MASHFDTVADFIKEQLETIDDIGKVYTEDIKILTTQDANTYCKYTLTAGAEAGTDVYRFWLIDCESIDADLMAAGQTAFIEEWVVTGFFGYISDPDGTRGDLGRKTKFQEFWRDVLKKFYASLGFYGSYGGERLFTVQENNPISRMSRLVFANIYWRQIEIRFRGTYDESFNV